MWQKEIIYITIAQYMKVSSTQEAMRESSNFIWSSCSTPKPIARRSQIQLQRGILFDYKVQHIKVSSFHAGNVTIMHGKQLWREFSFITKVQYMKVSSTHAGNAIIKQFQMVILFNTEKHCMKESNTFADNVTIKQLQRKSYLTIK